MKTITLERDTLSELLESRLKAGIGIGMFCQKYGISYNGIESFITQETRHIINKSKYTPPFRVGRKNKRAILDANGLEYIVLKEGMESEAQTFCEFLNIKNVI